MIKEFKNFLIKWNAIDMAVWFIFGAAFATFIKSFVTNIIMPPIWLVTWWVDFSNLYISLDWNKYDSLKLLEEAWAPAIKYWVVLTDFISFIILWFIIFMIIKSISKMQKKEEPKAKEDSKEVKILEEIRDALKKSKK